MKKPTRAANVQAASANLSRRELVKRATALAGTAASINDNARRPVMPEALDLGGRMADAWIAFARGGDPNHAGLPRWPAYDAKTVPTRKSAGR